MFENKADKDEKKLLTSFAKLLRGIKGKYHNIKTCGYNIKQFDIPYVCKRMLINNISLPSMVDFAGKKPWEVDAFDLMEHWKYGGFDSPSMDLLAHSLGVASPKTIMDGSAVSKYYWEDDDLPSIKSYCEDDVTCTADIIKKLKEIG